MQNAKIKLKISKGSGFTENFAFSNLQFSLFNEI